MTRYGTFIQPTDYCRKLPNSWPISEEGSVGVFPKVTVLCTQGLGCHAWIISVWIWMWTEKWKQQKKRPRVTEPHNGWRLNYGALRKSGKKWDPFHFHVAWLCGYRNCFSVFLTFLIIQLSDWPNLNMQYFKQKRPDTT